MADPQTSVAINIGSQRISMAVFETSKSGGLLLKSYGAESIVADPSMDASRVAQSRVAIADLAARLKLGKTKARYAISGQAVFTRFVKLPPVQDDNIEQLVTFEAQQHIPFPLDEVVWDYELIHGSSEKEAAIVAIKSDALDEINTAVNDCGIGTIEVDVAPMALYNAFRANYEQTDEPILLIDIGAKTSNLLYIEGRRFFTRSIAVGGAAITAAIAKEYGVSFIDAEHHKVAHGLVALGGGHTEQLDEAVAALAMVIRNALGRLPAEITRTTNYYRSQHSGSAPRRVLLAGGGANLPYTLEFFEEKLNLPVKYFNPVRNLAIGKGVDASIIQSEGHLMGELVGLGLRGIGKSEINIDLVPATVEQTRAADRRKPFFIAAAAVFLSGMALWAGLQKITSDKASDLALTMSDQRESLAPIKVEIEGLLKKEAALRKIADAYTTAESDQVFWMDLVTELKDAFASDVVWLTDMTPIHGYDPLLPRAAPGKSVQNGIPIVKDDFTTMRYGMSSLVDIQLEDAEEKSKSKSNSRKSAAVPLVTANAVRIRGFWRENPRSHNVVSELLANLRANSTSFRFSLEAPKAAKGKNGAKKAKTVETPKLLLRDEQILDITVTGNSGELGLPFEITLPLAREVVAK